MHPVLAEPVSSLSVAEPQTSLLTYRSVSHTRLRKLYSDSLKYRQDGAASKG